MAAENDIPLNAVDLHVGRRLQARREVLGLTEAALATAIGVSPTQLTEMEAGTRRIGHDALLAAALVMDVPERYFYERI